TAGNRQVWEEAAGLVERLAEVVSRGHESGVQARQFAVGVSHEWGLIRPKLSHFRRLIGGAAAAGCLLVPWS
ncbi:MAG: hypothetical protein VKJ09_15840, partial [Leptolyngbya sp.]|nr:hypothetical protein [Leptolyngbya sp.]